MKLKRIHQFFNNNSHGYNYILFFICTLLTPETASVYRIFYAGIMNYYALLLYDKQMLERTQIFLQVYFSFKNPYH